MNAGVTVSATEVGLIALLFVVATASYLRHLDLAECTD